MSNRLTLAIVCAAVAHDGQPYGEHDYIWHPLAVAADLRSKGYDEDTVIAGLLHDVPEDTDVTVDQIYDEFGVNVGNMVGGMTKTEGQDNGEYIIAMPWVSLPIKLSDSLKNFFHLKHMSDGPRKEKLTERYLRNISHIVQRMTAEGVPPYLTKSEGLAYTLAHRTYPEGWGEA